ncbi:MAG: T9SS type A sorting domain-containing protein [Bacteroidota bacterium]
MKKFTFLSQLMLIIFLLSTACFAQNTVFSAKHLSNQKNKNSIIQKAVGDREITPNIYGGNTYANKAVWDILYNYTTGGAQEAGVETDGNYIYTSKWAASMFYRYSLVGTLLDSFSIATVPGIRDLAFDGTYFYGGANTATIYKMDFTAHTLIGTIACPAGTTVRNIAYDSIRGGFWVGGWNTNILCVSPTGTVLGTVTSANHGLTGIYGSAYDCWSPGGPYLWLFDQGTAGTGAYFNQISLTSMLPTGVVHNCSDISPTALAGGAFCIKKYGIVALGGLAQGEKIFAYTMNPDQKDAGIFKILSPNNTTSCTLTASEPITVLMKNYGSDTIKGLDVSYKINLGGVVTESIPDTILPGASRNHTFGGTVDFSAFGNYTIQAYTSLSGDNSNLNDTAISSVISADVSLTVNIHTDNYGSETKWQLKNATTGLIVAKGGPYIDVSGGELKTTTVCALSSACYIFSIYDAYGDGNCCTFGNGSYEIQWNGISLGIIPGQFADSAQITNICQPQPNDVGGLSIDMANNMPTSIIPKGTVKNYGTLTQSFTATMEINPGAYTSTQNISSLAPGLTQQVTFAPNWTPTPGTYTVELYTTLAGGDANAINDTVTKVITITLIQHKAYCYIAYDASGVLKEGPAILDLDSPASIIKLADQTGQNFLLSGTWITNKWYAFEYTSNNLITIDTATGARTVIAALDTAFNGMAYDYKTSTLFGVSSKNLFSINPATGAKTLIGAIGVSGSVMINLACSPYGGNLYTVNITDDLLYAIDKTTGAATSIGTIGFDASYAQDMEFGPNSICYMVAYNGTTSAGELRTVNTTTGATTLIGALANNAEVTGFAIPGDYVNGINDPTADVSFSIYPNPAKDAVTIVCSNQIKSIKMVNLLGQVVLQTNAHSSIVSINTTHIANGFYCIQIETSAGFTTKNLTIQK